MCAAALRVFLSASTLACATVLSLAGVPEAAATPLLKISTTPQRLCAWSTDATPTQCLNTHLPGSSISLSIAEAVQVDGDTAVMGLGTNTSTTPVLPDAIYVFRRVGANWIPHTPRLLSPDTNFDIGETLALSGSVLLAGATNHTTSVVQPPTTGTAYVFTRSGPDAADPWTAPPVRLQSANAAAADFFGHSIALSSDGNTAVVGARGDASGEAPVGSGAVYTYVRSAGAWSTGVRVTQPTRTAGAGFGTKVAVDGNWMLVNAGNLEQVFAFERTATNTWTFRSTINAPVAGGAFGDILSISGERAVIGTPSANAGSGLAYFYLRNGNNWVVSQPAVQAAEVEVNDAFGSAVALHGDRALVGAPVVFKLEPGEAHAFALPLGSNVWGREEPVLSGGAMPENAFGAAVDLATNAGIVGAPNDACEDGVSVCGAAYVFSITQVPPAVPALSGRAAAALAALMSAGGLLALGRRRRAKSRG